MSDDRKGQVLPEHSVLEGLHENHLNFLLTRSLLCQGSCRGSLTESGEPSGHPRLPPPMRKRLPALTKPLSKSCCCSTGFCVHSVASPCLVTWPHGGHHLLHPCAQMRPWANSSPPHLPTGLHPSNSPTTAQDRVWELTHSPQGTPSFPESPASAAHPPQTWCGLSTAGQSFLTFSSLRPGEGLAGLLG